MGGKKCPVWLGKAWRSSQYRLAMTSGGTCQPVVRICASCPTHSRPTTPFTVFTNPLPPLRLDGHFYTFLFPIFPFTIIPTIEHVS
jgi:hypothetical protein